MSPDMARAAAPSKPAARHVQPASKPGNARSAPTLAGLGDIARLCRAERRVRLLFHQMVLDEAAREMGYADMRAAVKDFALTELDNLARGLGYASLLDFARQRNEG